MNAALFEMLLNKTSPTGWDGHSAEEITKAVAERYAMKDAPAVIDLAAQDMQRLVKIIQATRTAQQYRELSDKEAYAAISRLMGAIARVYTQMREATVPLFLSQ